MTSPSALAASLAAREASDRLAVTGGDLLAAVSWTPVTPGELHYHGIYRLFGDGGRCLHSAHLMTKMHPLLGMLAHRYTAWWPGVTHGEYKLAARRTWTPVTFSELHDGGVYRLSGARGRCLYAGQCRTHPMRRMLDHYYKASWWPEVMHADYTLLKDGLAEVSPQGDTRLDALEHAVLLSLRPSYNLHLGKCGWTRENDCYTDLSALEATS